jgi:hypothetical protein
MPTNIRGVCFNDDRCPLPKNWTRMSRSNLSRTALVSPDARARPVAQGAAFEAQVPPEVRCEDSSRSPVHHEGGARKATLPLPWRAIDRSQDGGRQSPHSRGAAATLEGVPLSPGGGGVLADMLTNLAFNPRSQRWSFRVTRCQRSKTARSAFRRSKIEKNRNGAPLSNHPRCRLFGQGGAGLASYWATTAPYSKGLAAAKRLMVAGSTL